MYGKLVADQAYAESQALALNNIAQTLIDMQLHMFRQTVGLRQRYGC